ncbi:unnamed protein product, partial [Protopolystoma xenopodis]
RDVHFCVDVNLIPEFRVRPKDFQTSELHYVFLSPSPPYWFQQLGSPVQSAPLDEYWCKTGVKARLIQNRQINAEISFDVIGKMGTSRLESAVAVADNWFQGVLKP